MSDGLSDAFDRRHKLPLSYSSNTNKEKQTILTLANNYDSAAAQAFRTREDEAAHKFRETADLLRKVAEKLPPIPTKTR